MDVSTRIEIVKLCYSLGESATAELRGYKTKHGLIKDPLTVSTIARLIAKFESTESVLDIPGKRRKSLSDERAPILQNAVEQLQSQSTMASSSINQVSQLTGIPRASVHRIMRRHLHHPTTQNKMRRSPFRTVLSELARHSECSFSVKPKQHTHRPIVALKSISYSDTSANDKLHLQVCTAWISIILGVNLDCSGCRKPPGVKQFLNARHRAPSMMNSNKNKTPGPFGTDEHHLQDEFRLIYRLFQKKASRHNRCFQWQFELVHSRTYSVGVRPNIQPPSLVELNGKTDVFSWILHKRGSITEITMQMLERIVPPDVNLILFIRFWKDNPVIIETNEMQRTHTKLPWQQTKELDKVDAELFRKKLFKSTNPVQESRPLIVNGRTSINIKMYEKRGEPLAKRQPEAKESFDDSECFFHEEEDLVSARHPGKFLLLYRLGEQGFRNGHTVYSSHTSGTLVVKDLKMSHTVQSKRASPAAIQQYTSYCSQTQASFRAQRVLPARLPVDRFRSWFGRKDVQHRPTLLSAKNYKRSKNLYTIDQFDLTSEAAFA
ncbi:hypothetical protein CLF_106891 [Clonorchis sinensis]|uniref:DUF4817 domain-containing protein n=1 Tax=Clonorchis sinensis TaxID=79923 RepID=G7YFW0_CLOSI|nr:hypothetical protein CLF_106891 [Clonorchis sinensis]